MRVLLTGATGFLGSHLLKRLLSSGFDVVLLKRSTSDCARINAYINLCAVYDTDQTEVEEVFRSHKIDAVIHCATSYGRAPDSFREVLESNLLFPLRVLEATIQSHTGYFLNTDSFYTKQLPERLDRRAPLYMPEYTLTKCQFCDWGRLRAAERKVCFINLQLEHVYGPDDAPGKFIPFLVRSMRENREFIELTDGIQIRDFVHVDDVVEAYLCVLHHLEELSGYQSFEIGTGHSHTVRQLAETIKAAYGACSELRLGAIHRMEEEIMYSTADNSALTALGWHIQHTFSVNQFTVLPPPPQV